MSMPQSNARLLFVPAVVAFASLLGAGGCPRPPTDLDPADPNSVIAGIVQGSGAGAIVLPPGDLDGDGTLVEGDGTSIEGDGAGSGTVPGEGGGTVPGNPPSGGGASNGGSTDGESPVVYDLGVLTPPDTPIEIELSGASPAGLPLEFAIVAAPVNGSLSEVEPVDDLTASVTFTPPAGFQGHAQFSYEASDGINDSNVGTVVVLVYPLVYFALDVYEGDAPLTVVGHAFTMTGDSLPDGEYRWSWGDLEEGGPVATFGERAHTFVQSGTYTVKLSILLAGLTQPIGCMHSHERKQTQFAAVVVSAPGALAVSPAEGLESTGYVGGPFTPDSKQYTLTNRGESPLTWTAAATQAWVAVSTAGGMLLPDASVEVTVFIDDVKANELPEGTYKASVTFTNVTNGQGNTTRSVSLTVALHPNLTISGHVVDTDDSPVSDVTINGLPGNPQTNSLGDYSATVSYGWSGTATPTKAGYTFNPASRTYSNVTANQTGQNYTASLPGDCEVSSATWQNFAFDAQSGGFTVEFDATPNDANMDGITALSAAPGQAYADFAVLVRFNSSGTVDARNGGAYDADVTIPYTAGTTYHLRLVVNVLSHTYSVYVTPQGAGEQMLASNYAFRTEQGTVTSLSNWGLIAGLGSHQVCNFTVQPGTGPGTLAIAPSDGLSSSGSPGGPFNPPSKDYTLTNVGGQPINWTATKTQSWVSLSSASGSLAAGGSATVTVSINSGADSLPEGTYNDTVTFTNATNGSGNTTRSVSLTVSTGEMASSISQYGITWTFDQPHQVGQFVNGDWWVVGPITVVSIDPPPMVVAFTNPYPMPGNYHVHGSVIDPATTTDAGDGWKQGYDERQPLYDGSLRVGESGAFVLGTDKSLVSTASILQSDLVGGVYYDITGYPVVRDGGTKWCTYIKSCAILTCLATPPPTDTFRPPYCATAKSLWTESQIHLDRLTSVAPQGAPPNLSTIANLFQRPWLDHQGNDLSRTMHPADNMPNYSETIASYVGDAGLLLCCNYSPAEKRTLLLNLIQRGIDAYGCAQLNKHLWRCSGGHGLGRKFMIQFAGRLLADDAISALSGYENQEDDGTYFGTGNQLWTGWQNSGHPYAADVMGLAFGDWGPSSRHEEYPPSAWGGPPFPMGSMYPYQYHEGYRRIAGHVYAGQALAARMLGMKGAWNHDAFFAYVDRCQYEEDSAVRSMISAAAVIPPWPSGSNQASYWYPYLGETPVSPWQTAMYGAYRPSY